MSPQSEPPLDRMLEDLGRPGTPEDLARRGVGRVRSLSAADLSKLIRQSVNRTLLESTVGVEPAEIDRLSERARVELNRLLSARRELGRTEAKADSLPAELSKELGLLQVALRKERLQRETPPEPETSSEDEEQLTHAQIGSLVAKLSNGGASAEWTESRLNELFAKAVKRSREDAERRSSARLDLLERRLAKVVRLLDETEGALAEADSRAETGLSSTFRQVQGLSPDDPKREVKERFLRRVMTENLEHEDS